MSVAKAGIIASLNARTSVLASANPVGSRYNPRMSVIDNIQLPPSLLSRFDLIYLVLDKINEQTDRKLARHLIALYYEKEPVASQVSSTTTHLNLSLCCLTCRPIGHSQSRKAFLDRATSSAVFTFHFLSCCQCHLCFTPLSCA